VDDLANRCIVVDDEHVRAVVRGEAFLAPKASVV
jgi:hypothetical protein